MVILVLWFRFDCGVGKESTWYARLSLKMLTKEQSDQVISSNISLYDCYGFSSLVGWHPSGTMLASASFDATVCVWDRKDGGKMWKDTQVSYVGNFGWVKYW